VNAVDQCDPQLDRFFQRQVVMQRVVEDAGGHPAKVRIPLGRCQTDPAVGVELCGEVGEASWQMRARGDERCRDMQQGRREWFLAGGNYLGFQDVQRAWRGQLGWDRMAAARGLLCRHRSEKGKGSCRSGGGRSDTTGAQKTGHHRSHGGDSIM